MLGYGRIQSYPRYKAGAFHENTAHRPPARWILSSFSFQGNSAELRNWPKEQGPAMLTGLTGLFKGVRRQPSNPLGPRAPETSCRGPYGGPVGDLSPAEPLAAQQGFYGCGYLKGELLWMTTRAHPLEKTLYTLKKKNVGVSTNLEAPGTCSTFEMLLRVCSASLK